MSLTVVASRIPSRLLLFALAGWQTLKILGRRRVPPKPKRILIAHHLLLGDTLMLTPLLAKLREQYPEAQILMTTPKPIAPLYQQRPYGVIAAAYDPRDVWTLISLIKFSGFDLAIVPGDNRFSWLALALGAKWIVAFAGDRPAYKNWPVNQLIPYSGKPGAWGDMVAKMVSGDPPAPYQLQAWDAPDFKLFALPQPPYCVMHVGASSPLKLWDPEKWLSLAKFLTTQGYQIVWSAGRGEQKNVTAIDPDQRHISYAGELDLTQLWHFISHANLLICPDTGVAHMGRLVNTPTVALFGPGSAIICGVGDFWRNSPYRTVTVDDFPCRDQDVLFKRHIPWVRRCGRSIKECAAPLCMNGIEVKQVQRAISEIASEPATL